jgi:hypothetical protein
MADYINIRGQSIEVVASDPANPTLGQIWYNSTSNTLKGLGFGAASWATGGSLSTASFGRAGMGTQTAAVAAGVYGPSPSVTGETEEYNGTSWSSGGTLGTARYGAGGSGTLTAGLCVGGDNITGSPRYGTQVEEYNGTSWTGGGAAPTGKQYSATFGTQTATLSTGSPVSSPTTITILYDGSTWTTSAASLSLATGARNGFGIQTSGVTAGGQAGPTYYATTEDWNGSVWTSGGNLNTARRAHAGSGTSESSGIAFGGEIATGKTAVTEEYDGTSWTNSTSMATARSKLSGAGTKSLALGFGGEVPAASTATEEWTGAAPTTVTITAS